MNLGRIFANAIARRVAYLVVAFAFAALASLLGMPSALASTSLWKDVAHQKCMVESDKYVAYWAGRGITRLGGCRDVVSGPQTGTWMVKSVDPPSGYDYGCTSGAGVDCAHTYTGLCPVGSSWDEATKTCDTCASRSPLGPGAWSGVNADMQMCQDGCTFEGGIGGGVGVCLPVTIDGTVYQHCTSWGPTGSQCSAGVGNGSLAPPDSDGDGTSDGNDGSPNNPGSGGGGGQDGEGQPEDGSSSCGGPDQPACEADGSNSGSGKGNTSGGGGTCQQPPSSTGDAILAQIAYQTWATRCAIAANNGGTGGTPGNGQGDGGQPEWTEGNGPPVPEDTSAQDVADSHQWGIGISADLLDTENIFGNASCPALPAFSFFGVEIDTASFSWWCTLVSIMRAAILIMSAFTAIQILLGRF